MKNIFRALICFRVKKNTQLTLEQHRCELHGFTSVWIFFNKYIGKILGDLGQFEKKKNLTDELYILEIKKKFKKKVCHECIKYIYKIRVYVIGKASGQQ